MRLDSLIASSVEKIWLKGLQRTVEGYETRLRAIFSRISKIRTGAWPDMKKKGTAASRFFFVAATLPLLLFEFSSKVINAPRAS